MQNQFLHQVLVETDDNGVWPGVLGTLTVDVASLSAALEGPDSKTLSDVVAAQTPPGSVAGGALTVTHAATPQPLKAAATPCKYVWVGAPMDADSGDAVNTKVAFLGGAAAQVMPLLPSNFTGYTIPIGDASQLYVKVGADGEGVSYLICV